MIEEGEHPDTLGGYRETALQRVCGRSDGTFETAKLLLEAGADPNYSRALFSGFAYGGSPLGRAVRNAHCERAELLLKNGARWGTIMRQEQGGGQFTVLDVAVHMANDFNFERNLSTEAERVGMLDCLNLLSEIGAVAKFLDWKAPSSRPFSVQGTPRELLAKS